MRKNVGRTLALWFLPLVGALLIKLIYITNRKRFFLPENIPDKSVIFAFWHADLLMQPYVYVKFRQTPKVKILISEHFDGLLIAKTIRFFNLDSIHGSTTRGGSRVLRQGLKALDEGYDIGITPDGPKGPRYTIGDGIIMMAQKRHTKIVVLNCIPSSYWQLSSWDRFVVPKPFGILNFYASSPIDLDGFSLEDAKALLKVSMMEHALP